MSDVEPNPSEQRRRMGSRPRRSVHQLNCRELRDMSDASYNQAYHETTASRSHDNRSTSGNAFSATLGRRERALYIERLEPRFVELVHEVTRLHTLINTQNHNAALRAAEVAAQREEIAALQATLHVAIIPRDDRIFNLTSRIQALQQNVEDLTNDHHQREAENLALRRDLDRESGRRIDAEGRQRVAEHYLLTHLAPPTSNGPAIWSTTPTVTPPPSVALAAGHTPGRQLPPAPAPVPSPASTALLVLADNMPYPPTSTSGSDSGKLPVDVVLAMLDQGQFPSPDVLEPDVPGSGSASVACAPVEATPAAMPMDAPEVGATSDAVMAAPALAPATASDPVRTIVAITAPAAAATTATAAPPAQGGMPLQGLMRGPWNYSPVTPHYTASQGLQEGSLFLPSSHSPSGGNFGG